jgi:hypothetical protein
MPGTLRVAPMIGIAVMQMGCYNYLPLRRSSLVPSAYLAVTLSESGSEELTSYLGPNAWVVRGRYLAATERGLALSVESVESRRGDISHWAGETVIVPGEFVRGVEQRQVSRSKVVLLAGAVAAAFVVTYQAFGSASSGGLGGAGGPGPSPR